MEFECLPEVLDDDELTVEFVLFAGYLRRVIVGMVDCSGFVFSLVCNKWSFKKYHL